MLRSEVELVKQLLAQRIDPANETIDQRFKGIEKQLDELKKQIQGLIKVEKSEPKSEIKYKK